jgi:hypothetical protein
MDDDAMSSRLNPYISFPGTAREAMEFGGDAPNPDGIMHAQLGVSWMVNVSRPPA